MSVSREVYEERFQECIDALWSGRYKQGRACLRNLDGEYCCLGVAADLKENHDSEPFLGSAHSLNRSGVLYYGLKGMEAMNILVVMNDQQYKTFYEIADYMEYHKSQLFEWA